MMDLDILVPRYVFYIVWEVRFAGKHSCTPGSRPYSPFVRPDRGRDQSTWYFFAIYDFNFSIAG
jgi:hypothetical protein